MKLSLLLAGLVLPVCLLAQSVGQVDLPKLAVDRLIAQDQAAGNQRFAASQNIPAESMQAAVWRDFRDLSGHRELSWVLNLRIPDAPGLGLFLNEVDLPAGSYLQWRADNTESRRFTQADVSAQGRLFLGFVAGEQGKLTYHGPEFEESAAPFRLWRIDQVFRPGLFQQGLARDFGESNACHIDANCPDGDGWELQKSGNARLIVIVQEGTGYCSGNLMNNTTENGRPLVLTGYHCFDGFTPLYDLWRFDFEFRQPTCGSPNPNPPAFVSYTGSDYLAGRQENDFLLLQISDTDFDAGFHYFAGWDRSDGDVDGPLIVFHHPQGDVQKLSTGDGMTVFGGAINWDNGVTTPANHHFRMNMLTGNAEPGSSGSAVFDEDERVRGHINGGVVSCPDDDPFLWIGRLHLGWTGGGTPSDRLSDWLDPLQLDTMQWDGATLAGNTGGRILRGFAHNVDTPVAGVEIVCAWSNGEVDTVMTDERGFYTLPRPAATGLTISGSYGEDLILEGVNVLDAVAMRRHVLAIDTLSPLALLAGDVSNDGSQSIPDNLRLTQALLDINQWIERPSWLIVPTLVPLTPTPTDAWMPTTISISNPDAVIAELNFRVVKNGDANLDSGGQ